LITDVSVTASLTGITSLFYAFFCLSSRGTLTARTVRWRALAMSSLAASTARDAAWWPCAPRRPQRCRIPDTQTECRHRIDVNNKAQLSLEKKRYTPILFLLQYWHSRSSKIN